MLHEKLKIAMPFVPLSWLLTSCILVEGGQGVWWCSVSFRREWSEMGGEEWSEIGGEGGL